MRISQKILLVVCLSFALPANAITWCQRLTALVARKWQGKTKSIDTKDPYVFTPNPLLVTTPLFSKLRDHLNRLSSASTPATREDFLKGHELDPSIQDELKIFETYVAAERRALLELASLDLLPLDSVEDFKKHPRLEAFAKALERFHIRNEIERDFYAGIHLERFNLETQAQLRHFWHEVNTWIRAIPQHVQSLDQIDQNIVRLQSSNQVTLDAYLKAVSDYLNLFNKEPRQNYYMGNSMYPTNFDSSTFLSNPFSDEFEKVFFPYAMYFPTFGPMTLERLNDLSAAGVMPIEIVPGGKIVEADGAFWSSPLSFAGHDNTHPPAGRESIFPSSSAEVSAKEFARRSELRALYKSKIQNLAPSSKKRMEYLYFFLTREQLLSIERFLAKKKTSAEYKNEIRQMAKLIMDEDNQDQILKDARFNSHADAEAELARFFKMFVP